MEVPVLLPKEPAVLLRRICRGQETEHQLTVLKPQNKVRDVLPDVKLNRPGFPGECFICELRLPDHRFRWKH
ncbi:hypothetical protein, partial [Escherichia coli]|uniref:hypothetical protein n=1 Tax=Escherichia coli TaxID=562 RepID=UPI002036A16A